MTASRVSKRITFIIKSCLEKTIEDVRTFLDENFCFHKLTDSLSCLGLDRINILCADSFRGDSLEDISNETVIELMKFRALERQSHAFVYKWVRRLSKSSADLSPTQKKRKVDKCFSDYKRLMKDKGISENHSAKLQHFLQQTFITNRTINIVQTPIPKCNLCDQLSKSDREQKCTIKELEKQVLKFDDSLNKLKTTVEVNDSLNKDKQELKDSVKSLSISNAAMKRKLTENEKHIAEHQQNEMKKNQLYLKNYEYKRTINALEKENSNLSKELSVQQCKGDSLNQTIVHLTKKVKTEQSLKSKYKTTTLLEKKKSENLKRMLSFDSDKLKIRENSRCHRYSDSVRKTFVWWRGESADLSQNEISRYEPFKSKFSPDSEFGFFVVNYSTTIYLSNVKRVLFKTVFKYI